MSTDETSAPEHRTPEAIIAADWRLRCCGICDKDRVGDEPGDVHAGEWICKACLDTAPCERCDGEHNPLGPCPVYPVRRTDGAVVLCSVPGRVSP